jgi:hypothetical protein
MPIFCLRVHLGLLNLHKIGNSQKCYKFHVINFLSVNLIVYQFATKRLVNKNTLCRSISMISTVHTLLMHKLLIFTSSYGSFCFMR